MCEIKLHTDLKSYLEHHEAGEDFLFNQWLYRFKDDKGLSVVSHKSKKTGKFRSYGSPLAPFEIVLIQFYENSDDFELMAEPLGFLTEDKVNEKENEE